MRKRTVAMWLSIMALALTTFVASAAFALDGGGGNGGGGGRRGGGGGAGGGGGMGGGGNFQQMMADRMKTTLGATDEEWKVIEPLFTKVSDLQRQTRGGMGAMMGGGRRGRGGAAAGADAGAAPAAPAAPAAQPGELPEAAALTTILADANAKPEDIKAKLEAYRAAVKKVNDQLKTAREDLRKVLTAKQEAQLVLMGTLD